MRLFTCSFPTRTSHIKVDLWQWSENKVRVKLLLTVRDGDDKKYLASAETYDGKARPGDFLAYLKKFAQSPEPNDELAEAKKYLNKILGGS